MDVQAGWIEGCHPPGAAPFKWLGSYHGFKLGDKMPHLTDQTDKVVCNDCGWEDVDPDDYDYDMPEEEYTMDDYYMDNPYEDDRSMFADPGGRSALRAGTRCYPCPTCGRDNQLTAEDKRRGYQCDYCADTAEGFGMEY
jgi:DNA-directed RNA polymerase subunit RPC12/RpoP